MRTNREDIYISPVLIWELFQDTRKEVGEEVVTSSRYKVLREGWVVSMFAVALSMYEKRVWWVRPNKEDTAPDFYAFTRTEPDEKGFREGINREIEVFEWNKWSKKSLLDAILAKVHNWKASKIAVVCYVSRPNEYLDFKGLNNALKKEKIGVLEIWILTNIKEFNIDVVVQVYPNSMIIPVPNGVPSSFTNPYAFITKKKGKEDHVGGKVGINSEMEITVYPE